MVLLIGSILGAVIVLLFFACVSLSASVRELRRQVLPTAAENAKLKNDLLIFVAEREAMQKRPVLIGLTDDQIHAIGAYVAKIVAGLPSKIETVH